MPSNLTIKLSFSTIDRHYESRTFKTLKGAQKYARNKVGAHPDISRFMGGYAVGSYGDAKLVIREGCTYSELFPEEQAEIAVMEADYEAERLWSEISPSPHVEDDTDPCPF